MTEHCRAAVALRPLDEGSALAADNGTKYPILQGPMTRVSDVPEFAARVAEGGALLFLALALMRAPEVRTMLRRGEGSTGKHAVGCGRSRFRPGRTSAGADAGDSRVSSAIRAHCRWQARSSSSIYDQGIRTYLHVPSPGLLRMFVQQGVVGFVFEGRECGGHVGPADKLRAMELNGGCSAERSRSDSKSREFHIVFAAGIHDALSARQWCR